MIRHFYSQYFQFPICLLKSIELVHIVKVGSLRIPLRFYDMGRVYVPGFDDAQESRCFPETGMWAVNTLWWLRFDLARIFDLQIDWQCSSSRQNVLGEIEQLLDQHRLLKECTSCMYPRCHMCGHRHTPLQQNMAPACRLQTRWVTHTPHTPHTTHGTRHTHSTFHTPHMPHTFHTPNTPHTTHATYATQHTHDTRHKH